MARKSAKDRLNKMGYGGNPTNPTNPKKASASDLAIANADAKSFAVRRGLVTGLDTHVGDQVPLVTLNGLQIPYGAPILEPSKKYKPVPKDVTEFTYDGGIATYLDPRSGDIVEFDPADINLPQFKKTFENGGSVDYGAVNNLGSAGLDILNSIIGLAEMQNPNNYSKQPIVNASAVRNVVSPYNNFALGGVAIEAEGEEAIQTPDGSVGMINGPKHEQGGVDMMVPEGTKIYSDRVSIDGKTMTERKIKREKTLKRLEKLAGKNPNDPLLANTIARTKATTQAEEEKDMAVQNILNTNDGKAANGFDGTDPLTQNILNYSGFVDPAFAKEQKSYLQALTQNPVIPIRGTVQSLEETIPNTVSVPTISGTTNKTAPKINTTVKGAEQQEETVENPFTVGDMIGMGGNIFNAVAPLLNTLNAAEATKPNINRYLGFGKDAIDANDDAQNLLAETRTNVNTDIDTSVNTQFARNRNSARSVNTLRALDILNTMTGTKAKAAASDNYAKGMTGLMDRRGQIEMAIDDKEMSGETQRDIADKMDSDNMYSNLAENFVNFGNNIQGLGAALNTSYGNQVDRKILAQLSKYGLTFDEKGNLISIK